MTPWPADGARFLCTPGDAVDDTDTFQPVILIVFAADDDHARTTIRVLAEVFARRYT